MDPAAGHGPPPEISSSPAEAGAISTGAVDAARSRYAAAFPTSCDKAVTVVRMVSSAAVLYPSIVSIVA